MIRQCDLTMRSDILLRCHFVLTQSHKGKATLRDNWRRVRLQFLDDNQRAKHDEIGENNANLMVE